MCLETVKSDKLTSLEHHHAASCGPHCCLNKLKKLTKKLTFHRGGITLFFSLYDEKTTTTLFERIFQNRHNSCFLRIIQSSPVMCLVLSTCFVDLMSADSREDRTGDKVGFWRTSYTRIVIRTQATCEKLARSVILSFYWYVTIIFPRRWSQTSL